MAAHLVISRHAESLSNIHLHIQSRVSEELNPFEMEVISKFDSIITFLQELEEQVSQARQEVLRKSTLEGKENGKIFAIKGRVIANKKKYYRSLEGDIQSLSKAFESQLTKINTEFHSLKAISGLDVKSDIEHKTPQTPVACSILADLHFDPVPQENMFVSPCTKSIAFPSIKRIDSAKKSPAPSLNKPLARPLFKANSASNIEIPKRCDCDKTESIPNPYGSQHQKEGQALLPSLLILPEVPEGEESNQIVSKVRLGLLDEVQGADIKKTPKVMRSIRGHGFKLSPTAGGTIAKELRVEPQNTFSEKVAA